MDRSAFVAQQRRLLELERRAEAAAAEQRLRTCSDAELVARGESLLRLEVADLEPAFGGRVTAVLRPSRTEELPAHRFGPGDLVALRATRDDAPVATGVVARVRRDGVAVTLDDEEAELPSLVRVDRIASDVTWRRIEGGLQWLGKDHKAETGRRLDVWFGERPAEFAASTNAPSTWFDGSLDASQREAVAHALAAEHLALIHGPPGTGKTTALVEFVRQVVARGERVLACAASNVAVDNLAERLARGGLRVVRLGHPARVQSAVQSLTLAAQLDAAPEQKLLRDVRRELDSGLRKIHRATSRADRAAAREEVRQLRREQRELEGALARGIVDGADVVLSTLTGAADALLEDTEFPWVVLDEAAQALEAACWIPLRRARRAVLAGDHRQLPPTIHSAEAARAGLACTLFERSMALHPQAGRMLTLQYRMHRAIMAYSGEVHYEGRLQAAPAVAEHLLDGLVGATAGEWTSIPLRFIDTAGTGCEESAADDEGSKANPGEAALVAHVVRELLAAGVAPHDLAVITPYNAQVQALRRTFVDFPDLEIGSVDGLQGREKEAVVLSLVRSNDRSEVGFLADLRRLNVAVTRARRHLTVIADSATLANDGGLLRWIDHLQARADYRSGFEFPVLGT